MKILLKILCVITAIFCIYFPLKYFHSDFDKKEIKISHILVDSEEKINSIRQDIIDKKILFSDAAKEYSTDVTAKDGGDIGYNTKGFLIPDVEKTAFSTPKYGLSQPIKTKEGWHLLKITDIKYFSDKENFARKY